MFRKKESDSSEPCIPLAYPLCGFHHCGSACWQNQFTSKESLKKNSRDRCPECEDGNIAKNRGLMCTLQMFQKNAALGVQRSRWGLPREMLILWDDESFPTIYHPCPQAKSLKPGRFHFFSPWSGQFNSAGVLLQQPSWLGTFCIPFGHWGLVTTLSTLLLFCCLLSPQLWPLVTEIFIHRKRMTAY